MTQENQTLWQTLSFFNKIYFTKLFMVLHSIIQLFMVLHSIIQLFMVLHSIIQLFLVTIALEQ